MTTEEITMTKKAPTAGEQIAKQILDNYDIKDAQDVQDILKQIFGSLFESMLKGEMAFPHIHITLQYITYHVYFLLFGHIIILKILNSLYITKFNIIS